MTIHSTLDHLQDLWSALPAPPPDHGTLEMIVVRPATDLRETPASVALTSAEGTVGDRWGDGQAPDPDAQIALINSGLLSVVAGSKERWPLAGDNLVVDLDLSIENLPAGTRLRIGSAVLEITALPHTGCSKFSSRFGPDALRFVNLGDGPAERRRGVHARVVVDGQVSVGDTIVRV